MPNEPRVYSSRYEIVGSIARGGTSEVFLAHDRHLDRPVAIKVLSGELSRDPNTVKRFRREAQAAANLSHPNIVPIYDWGQEDGAYYIVMEYIDGESLSDLLGRDGTLDPDRAAGIAGAIAAGLGFAHRSGVVHRDVKPANVLITRDGQVRVTDFGIARTDADTALTQAGTVMGTATYFSPEQAQGHTVDGRSDVYSLGVVLYEMVTGSPPFTGDSPLSVAFQHVREPVPPPRTRNAQVPRQLEDIIMTALYKDPAARYRRIEDLRADLARFRQSRQRPGVAGPALVGAAVAGAAATTTEDAATSDALASEVPATGGPGGPTVAMSADAVPAVAASTPAPPMVDPGPSRRNPTVIAGVTLAIVAMLGAIGILVAREFDAVRGGSGTAEVPNVMRTPLLDVEEATRILTDAGFEVQIDLVDNDLAPEDTVLSQTPSAGTRLKQGDTVTLGVSNGPGEATIPEVAGNDVATATATLSDAGFRVATRERASSDVGAGLVIRTVPGEGTSQRKDSLVTLVVSTGAPDVTVPDVAGLSSSDAANRLGRAGFGVEISQEVSNTVERDRVVRTSPAANARAPEGSSVTIFVSATRALTTVPDVMGETQSTAEQLLAAEGLSSQVESFLSPVAEAGRVIDQLPLAGTIVDPGSVVRIGVGDGLGGGG